ncbi:hypothetical protein GCM10009585_10960 [Brevibacterium paucivorans]
MRTPARSDAPALANPANALRNSVKLPTRLGVGAWFVKTCIASTFTVPKNAHRNKSIGAIKGERTNTNAKQLALASGNDHFKIDTNGTAAKLRHAPATTPPTDTETERRER